MNNEIPEKYLPLGTIVELDGFNNYVMIGGYRAMNAARQRMFDYLGCVYPIGTTNPNETLLFNHNQIVKIVFMGFEDERSKKFHVYLDKAERMNEESMKVDLREYTIENFTPVNEEEVKKDEPKINTNIFDVNN